MFDIGASELLLIVVIAIVAIGMTMVIITGGIDLSVGSLLALTAVLAARFIRDYAGGEEASAVGMTLACVTAILACGLIGAFSGILIAPITTIYYDTGFLIGIAAPVYLLQSFQGSAAQQARVIGRLRYPTGRNE